MDVPDQDSGLKLFGADAMQLCELSLNLIKANFFYLEAWPLFLRWLSGVRPAYGQIAVGQPGGIYPVANSRISMTNDPAVPAIAVLLQLSGIETRLIAFEIQRFAPQVR